MNANEKDLFQEGDNCYYCDDTYYRGINRCKYFKKNDTEIICQLHKEGYILLTNNNSCLYINQNVEFKKFDNCEKLTLNNNHNFYCSK